MADVAEQIASLKTRIAEKRKEVGGNAEASACLSLAEEALMLMQQVGGDAAAMKTAADSASPAQ